ncbi:MAG: DNA recombination protein RmuC [Bacteroidales bacterium]|nr:DNA recombination protein RmuC [Bacteroidales bacterium]
MLILYIVLSFLMGAVLAFLIMRGRAASLRAALQEEIAKLDKESGILQDRLLSLQGDNQKLLLELSSEREANKEIAISLARQGVEYDNIREKLNTQKAELEELNKKFTTEFQNIAHKILRENSNEFTSLNQKKISDILVPLKEKIEKFEKKVDDTYEKGLIEQTQLREAIKNLHELNSRISEEANNLTRALKSDSKKMGNWGEMILDRILEQSGLEKGKEYFNQYTDRSEEGTILRPDVVIRLPEKKHIIIDSKVSLIAYDRFVNSTDENDKDRWQKAHVDSVRDHIKGLSEKSYTAAITLDSPDFVLLFMPLESAFSLALQHDPELFNYAWQRRIVMVSPTTLLATLKTVESIWKHEKQTQNAMDIARQGTSLYDKFVNFIGDLEKIGGQIDSLQHTYQDAHKKLTSGKGNLVRQAEKLKELGIKTEKSLSEKLLPGDEE